MGVVELDGCLFVEVREILPTRSVLINHLVTTNDVLASSRHQEVLLFQAKLLAFEVVIVGVQHTGNVFGDVALANGLQHVGNR